MGLQSLHPNRTALVIVNAGRNISVDKNQVSFGSDHLAGKLKEVGPKTPGDFIDEIEHLPHRYVNEFYHYFLTNQKYQDVATMMR